ncbi:SRPBCC family protein [Ornithinimicrobium cerasi]|uniref:Polyketide cyclase / dehydrase and lipid transport n=1 Tax=Ornithinimicrobium cerasi TaxID=2248773 RepID=A0A285VVJ1_9MICO|nr:SRPBCC family protein [Ornithinimicrobium cerasi]SOC57266.1 Polyketide cyclase / dehydrase and lipid transport [Ornithinimicrobium cerasi]
MDQPQHRVELSRRIQAPPAAVWEVLTDLDRAQERLSQVTHLHVITDGPYALGTRWRETRRMMGASDTQEMTVVENDPLRSTTTEAVDGGTRYRTTLLLEPLEESGATLLSVRFSADVADPNRLQRLALRVVGPLGLKLTEKSLRTELDDIAAAAEALHRG